MLFLVLHNQFDQLMYHLYSQTSLWSFSDAVSTEDHQYLYLQRSSSWQAGSSSMLDMTVVRCFLLPPSSPSQWLSILFSCSCLWNHLIERSCQHAPSMVAALLANSPCSWSYASVFYCSRCLWSLCWRFVHCRWVDHQDARTSVADRMRTSSQRVGSYLLWLVCLVWSSWPFIFLLVSLQFQLSIR